VRWDGEVVAKRFREDTGQRLHVEAAILSRLAGVLPVPAVLPSHETLVLRLAYVAGATGQEWVARQDGDFVTRHAAFMSECGKFLSQLHALGSADLEAALPSLADRGKPGPRRAQCAANRGRASGADSALA
jgi:hypothetical protein